MLESEDTYQGPGEHNPGPGEGADGTQTVGEHEARRMTPTPEASEQDQAQEGAETEETANPDN